MGETAVTTAGKAVEEVNKLETVWNTKDLIMAGLAYTVMGILIVFLILVIIMMVIKAMALFSSEKKPKNKQAALADSTPVQKATETAVEDVPKTDELELVAVITAAIAAMTGESTSDFVVRSYKKVPGSSWNKAGRMEILDNKL